MNLTRTSLVSVTFACALSLCALPVHAQDQTTTTRDQTTTTTTQSHSESGYDSPSWQPPSGYQEAYPEGGTPNMVARQGYAAGYNQGLADAAKGRKFKPTDNDAYEHAKAPSGMDKDTFRQEFREAFVKGYSNGYKSEKH